MKLNSSQSVETGRKLLKTYGSWDKVREASRRSATGVLLVMPRDLERLHQKVATLKSDK